MLKLVMFVKRRPDLSHEAFREHYENVHAPLASANMPQIIKYVRNYLAPLPNQPEPPCDCVTEMWYEDEAGLKETMAWMRSDASRELHEDEDRFMDRSAMRAFIATECETDR
ncbi:conserved hypothetical protein [Sphingobium faniae]|nr:conserved hypothetical protein [Sphingobium faniae]